MTVNFHRFPPDQVFYHCGECGLNYAHVTAGRSFSSCPVCDRVPTKRRHPMVIGVEANMGPKDEFGYLI